MRSFFNVSPGSFCSSLECLFLQGWQRHSCSDFSVDIQKENKRNQRVKTILVTMYRLKFVDPMIKETTVYFPGYPTQT